VSRVNPIRIALPQKVQTVATGVNAHCFTSARYTWPNRTVQIFVPATSMAMNAVPGLPRSPGRQPCQCGIRLTVSAENQWRLTWSRGL